MSYRYYYSSVKGTSHEKNNTLKQDDLSVKLLTINGTDYIISVVADGAGSAKYSNISSKFVSKFLTKKISSWLENNDIEIFKQEVLSHWIRQCHKILKRYIRMKKLTSLRDFATTVLFAVISDNGNIFAQIGDGAIVIGNKEELNCVFVPQKGEYANMTHFVTEESFEQNLMFEVNLNKIERLAMHTDGIEMISLINFEKPSIAFFNPFFEALKEEPIGYNQDLSEELTEFLNSDRVNKKTDDDKTLVIVTRLDKDDKIHG